MSVDDLREREHGRERENEGRGDGAGRQVAREAGQAEERKWPLGVSLLIAVAGSAILWAGIILLAIRLWRWMEAGLGEWRL
jgi:hypothetical protein